MQANPWYREEELHNAYSHKTPEMQLSQTNKLILPYQDYCKTSKDTNI